MEVVEKSSRNLISALAPEPTSKAASLCSSSEFGMFNLATGRNDLFTPYENNELVKPIVRKFRQENVFSNDDVEDKVQKATCALLKDVLSKFTPELGAFEEIGFHTRTPALFHGFVDKVVSLASDSENLKKRTPTDPAGVHCGSPIFGCWEDKRPSVKTSEVGPNAQALSGISGFRTALQDVHKFECEVFPGMLTNGVSFCGLLYHDGGYYRSGIVESVDDVSKLLNWYVESVVSLYQAWRAHRPTKKARLSSSGAAGTGDGMGGGNSGGTGGANEGDEGDDVAEDGDGDAVIGSTSFSSSGVHTTSLSDWQGCQYALGRHNYFHPRFSTSEYMEKTLLGK